MYSKKTQNSNFLHNPQIMNKSLFFLLCFSSIFTLTISEMMLLPLTHSLSKTKFTSSHHLLKSTSTRSAARFQNHHRKQISLPLSPGSDYTLEFSLGSPNSPTISLYLDTGSDLVWLPCAPFECILCEGKPEISPPLNLSSSAAPVHCKSKTCSAAHGSQPISDLCAISGCPIDEIETSNCRKFNCPPFYYAYGDGSLIARLFRDSLILPNSLTINQFTFGCAHSTLAEPIGVAGFGRGALSFPTQLAAVSPNLGNRFSYCLIAHSFDSVGPNRTRNPSPLILGRTEPKVKKEEVEFVFTRMLENPKHPYFYSVGLEGISVGSKKIPAPPMLRKIDSKGGGGMVVDSGTTFTMLPAKFYDAVVSAFNNRVGRFYKQATTVEENTGLGPCYYYYGKIVNVPDISLHFSGNGSSVVLPRRNYFYEFLDGSDGKKKKNVGCLMLMNGGDEKEFTGGPWATLGNYQQQGFEVVYDLVKKKVGFAKRQCDTLWESLKQN